MHVKPETKNFEEILSVKKRYIIPRFQREYSWEDDELITMWDDLLDNLVLKDGDLVVGEYFIGSLVLVGDEDDSNSFDRLVVDGQQRLTTFTIAFSVLTQIFKLINEETLALATHSNIIGKTVDYEDYTILVTETPKPFFQFRVQEKEIDFTLAPNTLEEKRILNAYKFFEKRLSQYNFNQDLKNRYPQWNGTQSYVDLLKLFRNQVLRCKVIYVTVKSVDDAYTIFEVLNAKGKDLTPVDIIKNKLFSILTTTTPADYALEKWSKLRQISANNNGQDLLTFYRHFWLSKYKFSTNKQLTKDFDKLIIKDKEHYKEFLDQMVVNAEKYSIIIMPDPNQWKQPEDHFVFTSLNALDIFKTTQVRIFLLALFECRDKNLITHANYKKMLINLERFHLLYNAVCSLSASGIERRYSSYARELRKANDKIQSKKVVENLISALNENLPPYEYFEAELFKIGYTSQNAGDKKLVQYLIKKIETYYSRTNELQPFSFSIEHIMSESTRNECISQLGNLLPLGAELNNRLENKSFEQKMAGYNESEYKSVKKFIEQHIEIKDWNEERIIQRTKQLASLLYNDVWS